MSISVSIERIESKEKLDGSIKYIEDYRFDNQYFAITLRSTIACGKIESISYPKGYSDIHVIDHNDVLKNEVVMIDKDMPVFSAGSINHYGEPIALIIGKDKDKLASFHRETKVLYVEENGIYSNKEAAVKNSIFKSHNYKKGSLLDIEYTDIFEADYSNGYQDQAYMEKQGLTGYFEDGVVTIVGSIQCPFYIKKALANSTGLGSGCIRVIQATTGGAFGGKEDYPSLMACQLAAACIKLGKTITLIFDRREDLQVTTKKHPSEVHIKTYLNGQDIVGIEIKVEFDAGAYLGLSDVVLQRSILTLPGSYNFKNLDITGIIYKTNNAFSGAFRGFGAPQSMFAIEMHMNQLARRFNVDPFEYRDKYFLKQFDTSGSGGVIHEKVLLQELKDTLIKNSGYEKMKENKGSFEGIGISFIPHGGGFTGDGEASHIKAKVKLRKDSDNNVHILVANVDMGQGTKTALNKIVSRALEIPSVNVVFDNPDTHKVPDSGPTAASRTVMVVGGLLYKAAIKMKERMNEVDFEVEENYKLPEYVKWNQELLSGNAYMAYSWSAILARVTVNPLTYETTCTDIYAVYDIGVPIDVNLVRGQIEGGIIQGVGGTLTENMRSVKGKIVHDSFSSYTIPTTMDIPNMHIDWVDNYFEGGPFGAKPAGELTVVGVYPAIASAIQDAIDKNIFDIPVTPESLFEVIKNGK